MKAKAKKQQQQIFLTTSMQKLQSVVVEKLKRYKSEAEKIKCKKTSHIVLCAGDIAEIQCPLSIPCPKSDAPHYSIQPESNVQMRKSVGVAASQNLMRKCDLQFRTVYSTCL